MLISPVRDTVYFAFCAEFAFLAGISCDFFVAGAGIAIVYIAQNRCL